MHQNSRNWMGSEGWVSTILSAADKESSAGVSLKPQTVVLRRPGRWRHGWVGEAEDELLALMHRTGQVPLVPAAQRRVSVAGEQIGAARAPSSAHVRVQGPVVGHMALHLRKHQQPSQAGVRQPTEEHATGGQCGALLEDLSSTAEVRGRLARLH